MSDRIVGYPPTITVSGDVLTWAKGDFDNDIFGGFSTSHYIIKTNGTPSTSAIVSNDGAQPGGTYQITVTPGHGFISGDRCTPQVGNTTLTYTTIASAFVASTSDGSDSLRVWYQDTSDTTIWSESISNAATTKGVSIVGMLPAGRVLLFPGTNAHMYNLNGALGGITTQLSWENFSIMGSATAQVNAYGLVYNDTAATGAGVIISRLRTHGYKLPIWVQKSAAAAIVVKNCLILYAGQDGIQSLTTAKEIYHNTIAFCVSRGYNSNAADTVKNCLFFENTVGDVAFTTSTLTYCWSSDASVGGGVGNGTNKTYADIDFSIDNANNAFPRDYRVSLSAGVLAQGNTASGVTVDLDGKTRPGTPSIGASEGVSFATTPDFPAISDVENGVAFDNGNKVGSFVVPAQVDVRETVTYGNAAEFTGAFSCNAGAPPSPVLSVIDDQNNLSASVTLSGAEVASTNRVYTVPVSGGTWTLGATIVADGSGNGSSSVAVAAGQYWAKVESTGGSGTSVGNVVNFWITGGGFDSEEIRTFLRSRLAGDSSLTTLLATPTAIYHLAPALPATFPSIIYHLEKEGDFSFDEKGAFTMSLRVTIFATDAGILNTLGDHVERLFGGLTFTTTNWLCRRMLQAKSELCQRDIHLEDGRNVFEYAITYRLRILRKGA